MSTIQSHPIASGDINTTIVMETEKKRAHKRRNCSDTSTAMQKKKRKDCGDTKTETKKRKDRGTNTPDCGDDTVTSTATEKKKRKYCGDTLTSTERNTRKDCGTNTPDCGDAVTSTAMGKRKRKHCPSATTTTVIEKKKRKDCGDTLTSTVMEEKKRKDCGDTITSNVMETEKREDCGDTITSNVMEKYERKNYLPHDLILDEILTKLPVPTLLTSVLVSKLWYNSIHNDHKRLTCSHFLQSQKQPQVILSLLNVRVGFYNQTGDASYACYFFKFATTADHSHNNVLRFDKFRGCLGHPDIWELVGYCNGLPCVAQVGYYTTGYFILDPNRRRDLVFIFAPVKVGIRTPNTHIICHGFGFNSSANEYKLVSVFRTAQEELNFVVFTLGTKSWRDVSPTSTPISGHGGRPIIKIRAPTGSDKSAIFCATSSSGCLVWKIIASFGGAGSNDIQDDNSNEMEMLLSFNLHDEKFQFIQLPAKSTTNGQQKDALVDYPHLLEFKGFPCIARLEKKSDNGSDYPHRCCGDHKDISNCCCCCCKVHLYVLKDEVKQVWVKEEIIDVRLKSTPTWIRDRVHLTPDPCCFCFSSATTPPTRIFSFSGQLLLYWFDGIYLQVYNLHSGKLQLVLPNNDSKENNIFHAKKKEPRHVLISGADDIDCSNMDYQLHCHEENFLSLETFIPKGVEGVDADVFKGLDLKPCSAFVCIYRGSEVFYPSFY